MTYPFIRESYEAAGTAYLDDPVIHAKAAGRVINAVRGIRTEYSDDDEYENMVFYSCLHLLARTRDANAWKKYLAHTMRHYAGKIRRDLEKSDHAAVKFANASCGMDIRDGTVPVSVYLRHMTRGDPYWRLVNREVDAGRVRCDDATMARLIANCAESGMLARREKITPDWRGPDSAISDIRAEREKTRRSGRLAPAAVPPCMESCVLQLKNGENLTHMGRFAVAAFHSKRGMEEEDVAGMFQNAPDFDPSVTSYHVRDIRKKGMMPPNCSKMKLLGLCCPDEGCGGITSPLGYRRHRPAT